MTWRQVLQRLQHRDRAEAELDALGRVLGCVGIGLLLGLAGAMAVGRVIESLLIQVPPVDPRTLVLVPLLFAALVAVACAGPVRRAVSLDPSDVLRFE